jgi:hypothetical protein
MTDMSTGTIDVSCCMYFDIFQYFTDEIVDYRVLEMIGRS